MPIERWLELRFEQRAHALQATKAFFISKLGHLSLLSDISSELYINDIILFATADIVQDSTRLPSAGSGTEHVEGSSSQAVPARMGQRLGSCKTSSSGSPTWFVFPVSILCQFFLQRVDDGRQDNEIIQQTGYRDIVRY